MRVHFSEVLYEAHRRFAAAELSYGHGTGNAWDEAVALVVGVTGLPDDKSSLDAPLSDEQAATIRALARRRVQERRPLAYLLGRAAYCGEQFRVPEGIVVPRSPIGRLLVDGLRPWVLAPTRILDLCCGSGCLGILAARRFPAAHAVVADIDPLAVSTARRNVAAHGLNDRVRAWRSDLFAGVREAHETERVAEPDNHAAGCRFDLILCNPPYVDSDGMNDLPPEFAYEPAAGLDGGSDGLVLMNRVIERASEFLTDGGVLVGEVGEGAARLEARWPGIPFFWPDLPAGGTGVFLLNAADAP